MVMALLNSNPVATAIQKLAHPITGAPGDWDPLISCVGVARFVLLGEASQGAHRFYAARAKITKRGIRDKGFTVTAWEADWPDALRVNQYNETTAVEPLEKTTE